MASGLLLVVGLAAALGAEGSQERARTNAEPVRLAIVASQESERSLADLLTVEWSKKASLHLLERDQIEKVYREQGLSVANTDALKLGQVLGADGLLLLSTAREGTNQLLETRLVAVKPGVILGAVRTPWPVPDAGQWVKWSGAHFEPLLPKLGVLAKEAIPISVVNLRSAVSSAEGQELERQLTLLTIGRLAREPELFVLERRQLELLSAEKALKRKDESAFWSGSYLLEGVVDRDGYSKERVTLSARLVPPRGGAPLTFELSGSRTNQAAVVNELAARVSQSLRLAPGSRPWNPADEAAQYLQEAKWAYEWRMFPEAQTAAESAWALGLHTLELAELRVRSYCDATARDKQQWFQAGPPGKVSVREWTPRNEQIALNQRALEIYLSATRSQEVAPRDKPWLDLGFRCLEVTSQSLRDFMLSKTNQLGEEEALAALRASARQVAQTLAQIAPKQQTSAVAERIFALKLHYGWVWCDTPEEMLAEFKAFLLSEPSDMQRRQLLFALLHEQWFVEWAGSRPGKWPEAFAAFARELSAHTNLAVRLSAKLLEYKQAIWTWEAEGFSPHPTVRGLRQAEAAANKATEALLQGFTQNPDALLRERSGLVRDALILLSSMTERSGSAQVRQACDTAKRELRRRFLPRILEIAATLDLGAAQKLLAANEDELLIDPFSHRAHLSPGAASLFQTTDYDAPEQERLLDQVRRLRPGLNRLPSGLARFEKDLAVRQTPPQPQPQVASSPAAAPARGVSSAPFTGLTVSKSWLPLQPFDRDDTTWSLNVTDVRHRQGRLWVMTQYAGRANDIVWHVVPIDLATLKADAPILLARLKSWFEKVAAPRFEILGTHLYLSELDRLRTYDLERGTWETLPVAVQGLFSLQAVGDRLFLGGRDSLLEFEPKTQALRVLASSRRYPPLTPLDCVTNYGYPPFLANREGGFSVLVGDRLFSCSRSLDDWKQTALIADYQSYAAPDLLTRDTFEQGILVHFCPPYAPHRTFRVSNRPELEVLFEYRPEHTGSAPRPPGGGARWKLPPGFRPVGRPMALEGNNLWVAGVPTTQAAPEDLWFFEEQRAEPVQLPIRFDLHVETAGKPPAKAEDFLVMQMRATPAGIVLAGRPAGLGAASNARIVNGTRISEGPGEVEWRDRKAIPLHWASGICLLPKKDLEQALKGTRQKLAMRQNGNQ